MRRQPGYDQLATAYDRAFPAGFASAAERRAIDLFADDLLEEGRTGPVLDLGCGTGHVTHHLSERGLEVVGVDPSTAMLAIARRRYPDLRWVQGDATVAQLDEEVRGASAVVARFSLIHVEPSEIPGILSTWAGLLPSGAPVLLAFQCSADPDVPVVEFDHAVARAWRWHPDAIAAMLDGAGFGERWRLHAAPDGDVHRFPECHLAARLSALPVH